MSEKNREPEQQAGEIHERVIKDQIRALDEVEMIVQDVSGNVSREMSMRTDGRKEGSIDVDRTGPAERIRIAGTRLERPDNLKDENEYVLKDENEYVARFARALTNATGRHIAAIPKLEEDSDFSRHLVAG
jgi:hypothetical protein